MLRKERFKEYKTEIFEKFKREHSKLSEVIANVPEESIGPELKKKLW